MMKHEAKIQTVWTNMVKELDICGAFELKQTNTVLNFSEVQDHQIQGLLAIEEHGLKWKLSDADIRKKPCDMISTVPLPAYIVIHYRQEQKIVMIRIDDFVKYFENNTKKSIDFKNAQKISERIFELSTVS